MRQMAAALDLRGRLQVAIVVRKKSRSTGTTANVVFVLVEKWREVASRLVKCAARGVGTCTVPVGSFLRPLRLRLHCFCAERLYLRLWTGYEDMLSCGRLFRGNFGH
jgi:hypothetical protein